MNELPRFPAASLASEVAKMFDETRQEMLGTFGMSLSNAMHRTNGIMRTLTTSSILVLSAKAIFGFLGTQWSLRCFEAAAGSPGRRWMSGYEVGCSEPLFA